MRGDPPEEEKIKAVWPRSTPHARGSTCTKNRDHVAVDVYPACAGIHLVRQCTCSLELCLPRLRGDPPLLLSSIHFNTMSTPHARGSTMQMLPLITTVTVYPACAGIHLYP